MRSKLSDFDYIFSKFRDFNFQYTNGLNIHLSTSTLRGFAEEDNWAELSQFFDVPGSEPTLQTHVKNLRVLSLKN